MKEEEEVGKEPTSYFGVLDIPDVLISPKLHEYL